MNSKALLICFAGMDGTGKTTLSKELVELLNKKGIDCKYVYGRLEPFILKPFIMIGRLIFLRRVTPKSYSEYDTTRRNAIKKHLFLSRAYQHLLLFDCTLQIFFKVKLPLIFGKTIVCDRYIYDTVITDLSRYLDYSEDRVTNLLDALLRFFPEPDISFLIDVPEEIAFQRKDDIPSVEYLKMLRKMYLNAGKEYRMVTLDGSKSLEELTSLIKNKVFKEVKI